MDLFLGRNVTRPRKARGSGGCSGKVGRPAPSCYDGRPNAPEVHRLARQFDLLVLLAAVMLPAPGQGTQAAPVPVRPYALRDIPVGMTLTDFRRVRHPDTAAPADTRIVCSQDEGAH